MGRKGAQTGFFHLSKKGIQVKKKKNMCLHLQLIHSVILELAEVRGCGRSKV